MTESEKIEKNILPLRQRIRKGLLIISFLLLPIGIAYPVLFAFISCPTIINAASQGIVTGTLIIIALLFLGSLILGRFWCGYLCPLAGLQEIYFPVNNKKVRIGKWNWLKYLILLAILGSIVFGLYAAGGVKTINLFYQDAGDNSLVAGGIIGLFYGPIILVTLFALFVGKRSICHYWCPVAVILIIGRKIRNFVGWPALHLEVMKDKCIDCKKCSKECPMSLDVNAIVRQGNRENRECILCGSCVDTCPKDVLSYAWTEKKQRDVP